MVALIGPNGAGKTTLFNCLSGVIRPNSGRITFDGHSIDGHSSHQRARLGIARTFQRIELFTGMTVRDHLLVADRARTKRGSLFTDLLGRSGPTADEHERCDAMLELVGLIDDADKPAGALSLGRGRLVELARALMCEPKLLFLDEPSSGLDHHETEEMGTALQTVQADREIAILLCEHDVPFVERLAGRTYVLDVGHLIAAGDTAAVLSDDHVRAAYLGHTV
jgi:ABC-type branched-subunit amino acid transport system ATPase component